MGRPMLFVILVLILAMSACGGSSGGSPSSPPSSSPPASSHMSSSGVSSSSISNSSVGQSSSTASSLMSSSAPSASSSTSASSQSSVAPLSGLDSRPANSTCLAPERPLTDASIALTRVFSSLSFSRSLGLLREPLNNDRWYVIEQAGRVQVFSDSASPNLRTFIDIQTRVDDGPNEAGLLAMAFHPDFATNRQVFLYYTRDNGNLPRRNTLARYTSNDGGQTLDPASEEILLSLQPPYGNHYGGQLGFDNSGYLYLSLGDGGSSGDPGNRAQTTSNLFGSVLRIDVNSGSPYGIPADNPFAGNSLCDSGESSTIGNCPEIYAWGLRNPWRWSFDRATGDMWLADVGQDRVEEINIIQPGGNYGWRLREGRQCYSPSTNCGTAGLIDPVAVIAHPDAQSITGGYVYRGDAIPALIGRYLVGDFITGGLWALESDENGNFTPELLESTGLNIASFAEDAEGEVYVLALNGEIYRLDPATATSDNFPRLLSQTGCVDPANPRQPASGLIPYEVKAPFWSDGAQKQRWLALPDNTSVDQSEDGDWALPAGSVLMKHFRLADRLIETRLFVRHNDGQWAGYSYEWNSEGTDATWVQGGKLANIGGQEWVFPGGADCMRCHTAAAGRSLGLETAQLNGDLLYPVTGRSANQLVTHASIGVLGEPLPGSPEGLPRLVNPYDTNQSLDARARAYLHTNCAQCHRPDGPTNVNLDLRYNTEFTAMNICDIPPQNGNLGIDEAQLFAPGAPERSLLVERMDRRDLYAMPPLASKQVDSQGVALIGDWIASVAECP